MFYLREAENEIQIFTKETKSGFGTDGSYTWNPQYLHFSETIDNL